jgi:hypothetical protein
MDEQEAMGQPFLTVMRSDLRDMQPGETRTLKFAYGYLPLGFTLDDLLERHGGSDGSKEEPPRPSTSLASSMAEWRNIAPDLELPASVPNSEILARELTWRSIQLVQSSIYSDYHKEHNVPQGSMYLYIQGFDGAARDPLNVCPALNFIDPNLARETMRLVMQNRNATTGTISYSWGGNGCAEGYCTLFDFGVRCDLDLSLFLAVAEYISATGDYDFLEEGSIQFHPKDASDLPPGAAGKTTLDHIRAGWRQLVDVVGTGDHGLLLMRDGDWNDAITRVLPGILAGENTVAYGETMSATAQLIYTLRLTAKALRRADPILAQEMLDYAESFVGPLRAAFGGQFFARAWVKDRFNNSKLVAHDGLGDDMDFSYIDLESNNWVLLLEDLLSPAERDNIVDILDRELLSDIGYTLIADDVWPPGSDFGYYDLGHLTWPVQRQVLTWAFANFNVDRAWEELYTTSYHHHADVWPESWVGVLSGPDAYNHTDGDSWEITGLAMRDFPIQNTNADGMWIRSFFKILGIEGLGDEFSIDVQRAGTMYSISTTIADVAVLDNGVTVTMHPRPALQRRSSYQNTLRILLPVGVTAATCTSGSLEYSCDVDGRSVVFDVFEEDAGVEIAVAW